MDFPRLTKLKLPEIGEPVNLYNAGTMQMYDKLYDRITTKNQRPLESNDCTFHRVTTTDDAIISTLMCSTRSAHSWDIIVQRVGKKLFFDKRDDSTFDLMSVYETTQEEMKEEGHINSPGNLAIESTCINQNFSQQCLKSENFSFDNGNPFADSESESA